MFIKKYQMIFIFLLMIGTLIACSSSSWFVAWLGLELNLMMMIPLIIMNFNSDSSEGTIKYFLTQAMASSIFIISCSLSLFIFKNNLIINNDILLAMSLLIKGGIPPMHFWFPQIMEKISLEQCFIILTWQKIAPFILLTMIINYLFLFIIITSGLLGSLGGFNQTSLKKILTYSSIIHSSWMLSIAFFNLTIWFVYFLIYTLISFSIIHIMFFLNIDSIKKLSLFKSNKSTNFIFLLNILSLGGLPPLLGFIAKMMVLVSLFSFKFSFFIMLILILSSIIGLFFYMKIIYSMTMINSSKMIFYFNYSPVKSYNFLISLSIMLNIVSPIILFCF